MQKLQLSIPEPCHENWQNMTATEQGRFCNACAKEVVDFSMMTDREVLNYFSVLSNEKVCGRALPSQLDRHIIMPKEPKKRLFWYWNYIVMFFMVFSKANYSKAQKGEVVTVPVKKDACSITLGQMVAGVQVKQPYRDITGKITDGNGNPVPFATVKIKGSQTGVAADADGAYKIMVSSGDYLKISSVGYLTKEVKVLDNTVFNVTLENYSGTLGGLVVITAFCAKRENRVLGWLKVTQSDTAKKEKTENNIKITKDIIPNTIKIYPNPVQKGNSFLVSLKQQQVNDLNIQIIDMQGRVMLQKRINAVAKEHIEKIETDSKWGSGVYYIRVFNNNNKEISKTSFIVL